MTKALLLISVLWATNIAFGQNCSCSDTFLWLKETFEKNDAGYQYVLDQKGEIEYKNHSNKYLEKVNLITEKEECAETLNDWLKFFRNGHLWVGVNLSDENNDNLNQTDNKKIKELFKNWETYPYQEKEFKTYVSNISEVGIEGIWTTPPYTIGVKKVKEEYIGFIIEGDGLYWTKSQVKFKIREKQGKLSATYYMQDHSARQIDHVELLGNKYLTMDWINLERVSPSLPHNESLDMHFEFLNTSVPLFKKLDDKTVVFRIPSFSHSEKKIIDSIINVNQDIILSTENMIIDLRNNGGGSDASFQRLLPIIYTNPIREVGVHFLSTPLNNKRMEEFTTDPDFSEEDRIWAKKALEKLNNNIGEFVDIEETDVTIARFDTVYKYPKNVGIIINEGNGSTTEQFLLAAKQSKKVKLFGTTTFGVLDISNMNFITSPCNDFRLGYCLSKSKRIPDFSIDDKGIQPDFYIDKTIPKYTWINFVNEILRDS